MDDIKLFRDTDDDIKHLLDLVTTELNKVGLSLNPKKSATNADVSDLIKSIENSDLTYKYLGVKETPSGNIWASTADNIKNEMIHRLQLLCSTDLKADNLFTGINEWVISLIDYIKASLICPHHGTKTLT